MGAAAAAGSLAIAMAGAGDAPPSTPADPVLRLVDAGLRRGGADTTRSGLTDRIGRRLSGSDNLTKAIAWTSGELKRAGLDRVWTEPVMVPHWVRGDQSGKILSPVEHPLVLLALGMSDGTPPDG